MKPLPSGSRDIVGASLLSPFTIVCILRFVSG